MRYMMLMIPASYANAPAEKRPDLEAVKRMMKYNEELTKSGVLLDLNGLHPPAAGVRVTYAGGKPKITDGPFAEVKEVLGGYWMIQVKSKEEAIEWVRRVPANEGDTVEVRQVFEMTDFPPEIQKASDNPAIKAHVEQARKH